MISRIRQTSAKVGAEAEVELGNLNHKFDTIDTLEYETYWIFF